MVSRDDFLEALWQRHAAGLSFRELRRAAQAVSAVYVEGRRERSASAALASGGKRAAFAAYYGALHLLTVGEVVAEVGAARGFGGTVVDLGCGTAVAGAAWAAACEPAARVHGVEQNPWAVREARWTLATLRLSGRIVRGDAIRSRLPAGTGAVVAAYLANEISASERDRLWSVLSGAARRGARVLVLEPIARRAAPWWQSWAEGARALGGRADEWRLSVGLPDHLRELDRAAGLDHSVLTARSLYVGPR